MRSVRPQAERWKRLLRFLTGGGLATLVHWLVMFLLIQADIDARFATAIGATVGLVVNYLAQYRYTFRSGLPHRLAFSRYLASTSLGWCLNLAGFSAIYTATGTPMFSQAVASAATVLANYLLAEEFVFQEEAANDTQ